MAQKVKKLTKGIYCYLKVLLVEEAFENFLDQLFTFVERSVGMLKTPPWSSDKFVATLIDISVNPNCAKLIHSIQCKCHKLRLIYKIKLEKFRRV